MNGNLINLQSTIISSNMQKLAGLLLVAFSVFEQTTAQTCSPVPSSGYWVNAGPYIFGTCPDPSTTCYDDGTGDACWKTTCQPLPSTVTWGAGGPSIGGCGSGFTCYYAPDAFGPTYSDQCFSDCPPVPAGYPYTAYGPNINGCNDPAAPNCYYYNNDNQCYP
ncbi:unnamed protein product, partial [Mesorhabditis belari]|uniref:Uncharacterized protein n=1 Tax=Mesorhabditis belari TaxID=2138241 RepID=A0AAF3EC60_9BILA